MRDVSSTFALSTESSRPERARASSNARRAIRAHLVGVVLAGVEDDTVLANAARAVVEAADQLADDQQVDARRRPPGAGSRRRRAPCAARSARPRAARGRRPTSGRRPRRAAPRRRAWQAASVSAGSGSPNASIAAPPKACSEISSSSGSASSTRTASAATSGPIPSPGRQTIAPTHRGSRVASGRGRDGRARRRRRPRAGRRWPRAGSRASTPRGPGRGAGSRSRPCARGARGRARSCRFTAASSSRSTASIASRAPATSPSWSRSCRHPELVEQRIDVGLDLDQRPGHLGLDRLRRLQPGAGDERRRRGRTRRSRRRRPRREARRS